MRHLRQLRLRSGLPTGTLCLSYRRTFRKHRWWEKHRLRVMGRGSRGRLGGRARRRRRDGGDSIALYACLCRILCRGSLRHSRRPAIFPPACSFTRRVSTKHHSSTRTSRLPPRHVPPRQAPSRPACQSPRPPLTRTDPRRAATSTRTTRASLSATGGGTPFSTATPSEKSTPTARLFYSPQPLALTAA